MSWAASRSIFQALHRLHCDGQLSKQENEMNDSIMPFGAAYYPEQREATRWEHDLDMMAAAAITALRVGEFAWTRFEPSMAL